MIEPFNPKETVTPYPPTTLDIETDDGDVIAIGMAWSEGNDSINYETYHSWPEWIDGLTDELDNADKQTRRKLRTIYAHNGGGFDWLSLLDYGIDNELFDTMNVILSGGSAIGIDIKLKIDVYHRKPITIRLRDSFRLLPSSLAKLSSSFDVETPKQEISSHDISHMRVYLEREPEKFYAYLKADVLALQQVLLRFWKMIVEKSGNIGHLPMTLPSLAFRLWRKTLTAPMLIPENEQLRQLERESYTGGRTECYGVAIANVDVYDANSLYPSVMIGNVFPQSYAGYFTPTYEGLPGIYRITYNQTNRRVKPVLRDPETFTFTYTGTGTYTQPEIALLLEMGATITCHGGYVYTDMGSVFESFIGDWYQTRLEAQQRGDDALQFTAKILMNSSYGKFGMKDEGETVVLMDDDEMITRVAQGENIRPLGRVYTVEESRDVQNFVGIASYITAYARIELYRQIHHVEQLGGYVYAVDTDSVHISGATLPTGNKLGEWKLENSDEIIYLGKKLYSVKSGGVKAKGIGRTARENITHEMFRDIALNNGSLKVSFETFPTVREVLSGEKKSCKIHSRSRTIRPTAGIIYAD